MIFNRKPEFIDQSQSVLMSKFALYLKQQGRNETLAGGYCNSLSLLWLYYALQSKEQENKFFERIKKIAAWDGKGDLDTDFEKLFSHADWLQRKRITLFGLSSNEENVARYFDEPPLNDNSFPVSPIQQEHQFSFLFEKNELANYIENLIKLNPLKGFLIESHAHALAVIYDQKIKKYRFFDSNNPLGVIEFSHSKELIQAFISSLIFERERLKTETSKSLSHLPLNIRVIDIVNNKIGNYLKASLLVKKFVNDRLLQYGQDNLDMIGLDNATGLIMACKINNIEVAKEILTSIKDKARKEKLVNTADNQGWSPLKIALSYPLPLARMLVENGAMVSLDLIDYLKTLRISNYEKKPMFSFLLQSYREQTLNKIYLSIRNNDFEEFAGYLNQLNESIKQESEKNEKINWHEIFKNSDTTPLHEAIKANDFVMIETILALMDGSIDIKDSEGLAPLDLAIKSNNKEIIETLQRNQFFLAIKNGDIDFVKNYFENHKEILREQSIQGYFPLHLAIAENNLEIVNYLLQQPLNQKDFSLGFNGLHLAIKQNNLNLVKALVNEYKYDVIQETENGESALFLAAKYGDVEMVEFLLTNNPAPIPANAKKSPLIAALSSNRAEIINKLIKVSNNYPFASDPSYNQKILFEVINEISTETLKFLLMQNDSLFNPFGFDPKFNNTLFHQLCLVNKPENIEKIKILLSDPQFDQKYLAIKNKDGQTVLHLAAKISAEITALLINNGALVNDQDNAGKTVLHLATEANQSEIVTLLLKGKADPTIIDLTGKMPIHFAIEQKNEFLTKHLIENQFKQNILNQNDKHYKQYTQLLDNAIKKAEGPIVATQQSEIEEQKAGKKFIQFFLANLFSQCIKNDDYVMVKFLLGRCDPIWLINTRDKNNFTPLHHAVATGSYDLVSLLLIYGPNVNSKADYKRTPLHMAIETQPLNLPIIKRLIEHKADVNARLLPSGRTPLQLATMIDNPQVAELLIQEGADPNVTDKAGKIAIDFIDLNDPNADKLIALLSHHSNIQVKVNLNVLNNTLNMLRPYAKYYDLDEQIKILGQLKENGIYCTAEDLVTTINLQLEAMKIAPLKADFKHQNEKNVVFTLFADKVPNIQEDISKIQEKVTKSLSQKLQTKL